MMTKDSVSQPNHHIKKSTGEGSTQISILLGLITVTQSVPAQMKIAA